MLEGSKHGLDLPENDLFLDGIHSSGNDNIPEGPAVRISREQMWMEMTLIAAKRSTCFRLNVGAMIVMNNRIPVSIGYNGQDPGAEHCSSICEPGECNTIHAEKNAIDLIKGMQRSGRLDMYVTDSPCMDCALAIHKAAITALYYRTPYRDTSPLHLLYQRGLDVMRITPSGIVISYQKDWAVRRRKVA